MNTFIRVIICAALLAFAQMSLAQVSTQGLTERQAAELATRAAELRDANKNPEIAGISPKRVGEWVDLGTNIGKGLGGAAKELGIAVNDFATTPVGMFTIAIIGWKFMGSAMMHILGAFTILIVGLFFIWYMHRRVSDVKITYDPTAKNFFGNSKRVDYWREGLSNDMTVCSFMAAGITVAAFLITLFSGS